MGKPAISNKKEPAPAAASPIAQPPPAAPVQISPLPSAPSPPINAQGEQAGKGRTMSQGEQYTRLGVGIAHSIGGAILTGFGGGQYVPLIGEVENQAIDVGFGYKKLQ